MDKQTTSNYGWVVVVIIIISILIGLATPFATAIKNGVVGATNGLVGHANNALKYSFEEHTWESLGGSSGSDNNGGSNTGNGGTQTGTELNEYGFYYGRSYFWVDTFFGFEGEYIFYEDGSVMYFSYNLGDFYPAGTATYGTNTANYNDMDFIFSENGTVITGPDLEGSLGETSYGSLQKGVAYEGVSFSEQDVVAIFGEDGSLTVSYSGGDLTDQEYYYPEVEFFHNGFRVYDDYYEEYLYGAIHPDGTKASFEGTALYLQ